MSSGIKSKFVTIAAYLLLGSLAFVVALRFDSLVYRVLDQPFKSGQLKAALTGLRSWGEGSTLVLVSLGLLSAQPRRYREIAGILLLSLASSGLADGLKHVTARARPSDATDPLNRSFEIEDTVRNSSLPSGHTATAFAFARGISLFCPAVAPVAYFGAAGTAVSRMYEKRHFFSDCVAGAFIGFGVTTLLWRTVTGKSPSIECHEKETKVVPTQVSMAA